MAFEEDLAEFYNAGEFADTITHRGVSITAMFFHVREEIDNIYNNHTYMTIPLANINNMARGDTVTKGAEEYRVKSITDHNSDKSIKVIELDYIRTLS